MTSDKVRQVVNNLVAAWNSNDADSAAGFYAPGYVGVDVATAEPHRSPDGVRQMLQRYRLAFPDLHFTAEDIIVEGNRATLVWRAHGTHQGQLMNIPPTGRRISLRGVSVLKIEDGKVVHADYIWDVAGLLRNIGLLPEL